MSKYSYKDIKSEISEIVFDSSWSCLSRNEQFNKIINVLKPICEDYEQQSKAASDAAWEREAYWQTEGWRKVHEMGEF